MAFRSDEIHAIRDYFVHKLLAEKQRNDVLHAVEAGKFDFVLLDTRGREPFASGHIPGALCASMERAGATHTAPAQRQRGSNLLLGPRLTALREGGSAVSRDGVPGQGDECRLEGVDLQSSPDAPRQGRRLPLRMQQMSDASNRCN